ELGAGARLEHAAQQLDAQRLEQRPGPRDVVDVQRLAHDPPLIVQTGRIVQMNLYMSRSRWPLVPACHPSSPISVLHRIRTQVARAIVCPQTPLYDERRSMRQALYISLVALSY